MLACGSSSAHRKDSLRVPAPALALPELSWRRLDLSERRGDWCIVDADDWDWIVAHRWNVGWHAKTPWKFYAKRNVGPARLTVYLHREVMRRAEPDAAELGLHVDHINGQSLDNRKVNLRWVTPKVNGANRRRRAAIPPLEAIVEKLAPAAAEPPF